MRALIDIIGCALVLLFPMIVVTSVIGSFILAAILIAHAKP
jgi:hypothetical protein